MAITIDSVKKLKAKLAATARGKEDVRRKLVLTARALARTAKEKEDVRRKLVVTAKALAVYTTGLEMKDVKHTAELVERVKELEIARAKERATLLSIGDGLFATDEKGNIIFINKKAEDLLGRKSEEVMGKVFSETILKEMEDGTAVSQKDRPIHMALASGTAVPIIANTYYYVRKNKTRFPVSVIATPIVLDGSIIGAIEVFRDITQEKAIDRAKSEFISVASHQLKTPATAIKLLSERLLGGKMGKSTTKQKEYFEDIHSSNERMIELVNALLKVSRIELGAYTIQVAQKDAGAMVASVLEELKYVIGKKRLQLTITLPKLPVQLMIDEHMFRIAIQNLVTNAVQYTKEGGEIRIVAKVSAKGTLIGKKRLGQDSFVVAVTDTGYGIPLRAQDKIFTKFFRADNARLKHTDGTGLGLYIVKSTLNQSGGLIWFVSRENKGSVFYVAIPMSGMRATISEKDRLLSVG